MTQRTMCGTQQVSPATKQARLKRIAQGTSALQLRLPFRDIADVRPLNSDWCNRSPGFWRPGLFLFVPL